MTLRKAIIVGLAGLVLLAGTAGKCDTAPTKSDPFPKPVETTRQATAKSDCDVGRVPSDKPNIGRKRYVTVYACVEKGFEPIEVILYIKDATTGEVHDQTEPSASTTLTFVIGYDTGHKVTMNLELKPSRPGSRQGFLYVTDGPANRRTVLIDGAWRAQVQNFRVAR